MVNPYVMQRMKALQTILNGVHQASAGLSSATTGQERAAFINDFLSKVLPPIYRFGSGDATDSNGMKSGQLDVVIEYPFSPSLPITNTGETRLYLAESVAAVIEVKSDISNQWNQAVHTAEQLAPLRRKFGSGLIFGKEPTSQIPLFVVGYTGWKNLGTLEKYVHSCPDIFGVLIIDSGLYFSRSMAATEELSLWALICDLHILTNSLPSITTDPLNYVR